MNRLAQETPAIFIVFDLLAGEDGRSRLSESLSDEELLSHDIDFGLLAHVAGCVSLRTTGGRRRHRAEVNRVFLLSPAHSGGKRAAMLSRPGARFELARQVEISAAALGDVFTFCSGLYFRGKLRGKVDTRELERTTRPPKRSFARKGVTKGTLVTRGLFGGSRVSPVGDRNVAAPECVRSRQRGAYFRTRNDRSTNSGKLVKLQGIAKQCPKVNQREVVMEWPQTPDSP